MPEEIDMTSLLLRLKLGIGSSTQKRETQTVSTFLGPVQTFEMRN